MSNRISTSRHSYLATEIGHRIVSGVYASGTLLPPEAQVLAEFGVSRPVLREAIKLLESKGMLEARQRRGTVITERNRWNLLDRDVLGWIAESGADPEMLFRLTEVRMIVEPGACLLAAQNTDKDALRGMEDAWQRMVAHVEHPQLYVEADRDFHLALLMASGNEYLAAVGTAISAALKVSVQRTNPTIESNQASLAVHERILAALRRGDGVRAANASRRQLETAVQWLRDEGPKQAPRRAVDGGAKRTRR
nr:FadR/GntR family transcriptional regulator [Ramlibacter ginsenosidimutans]